MKGGAVQVNGVGMQLTGELSEGTPQEQTADCTLISACAHSHNTLCYYDILNALVLCVWSV